MRQETLHTGTDFVRQLYVSTHPCSKDSFLTSSINSPDIVIERAEHCLGQSNHRLRSEAGENSKFNSRGEKKARGYSKADASTVTMAEISEGTWGTERRSGRVRFGIIKR